LNSAVERMYTVLVFTCNTHNVDVSTPISGCQVHCWPSTLKMVTAWN